MQSRTIVKMSEPGEAQVRETRKSVALLEVSRALSATRDFKAGVSRALEIVRRHHGAIHSSVVLLDVGTGEVALEASAGPEEPRDERLARISSPITLDNRMAGVIAVDLRLNTARDPHVVQFLGLLGSLMASFARMHQSIELERRRLADENARLRDALARFDAVERGAAPCSGQAEHAPTMQSEAPNEVEPRSLNQVLDTVEKDALANALMTARGNRAKAARLLATTARIFNYRVRKHGIDWKRYRVRLP
jgi:transcriptional regulator with GAF, ATPase, and Fis domain